MSPQDISAPIVRDTPVLRQDAPVEEAVRDILDSGLPALPVVDERGKFAGIFGEREFMAALFPGYVRELRFAGFVPKGLDEALQKRAACRRETVGTHMNTEHVDVPTDASDVQVAETFLHHRVLIVPVTDRGAVQGVITRSDFFARLAVRFLEQTD
ncbi:MAG TPA: CBS domain-containing protein [Thermoleophilaceae bacterium]|nr:CBS domain-containing protein [Thermoleophilaceae bacterium]